MFDPVENFCLPRLCWPCARKRLARGALRLRTPGERESERAFRAATATLAAEREAAVAAYEAREREIAAARERWERAYRKKKEFTDYPRRYGKWMARCVRIHEAWEDYSRLQAAVERSHGSILRFAPRPRTPVPVLRHLLTSGTPAQQEVAAAMLAQK